MLWEWAVRCGSSHWAQAAEQDRLHVPRTQVSACGPGCAMHAALLTQQRSQGRSNHASAHDGYIRYLIAAPGGLGGQGPEPCPLLTQ